MHPWNLFVVIKIYSTDIMGILGHHIRWWGSCFQAPSIVVYLLIAYSIYLAEFTDVINLFHHYHIVYACYALKYCQVLLWHNLFLYRYFMLPFRD